MINFILILACGYMVGYMIGSFRGNILKLRANKLIKRADAVLASKELNRSEIDSIIKDAASFMMTVAGLARGE